MHMDRYTINQLKIIKIVAVNQTMRISYNPERQMEALNEIYGNKCCSICKLPKSERMNHFVCFVIKTQAHFKDMSERRQEDKDKRLESLADTQYFDQSVWQIK